MKLQDLGYSEKWVKYGLLDEYSLRLQCSEFLINEDQNTEHYRYRTFLNWLRSKSELEDYEIANYIELALEDPDVSMAGSAMKELFTAPQITDKQYEVIRLQLPKFGQWTEKLISRETLKRKLLKEDLTSDLFDECIIHCKKYKENFILEMIISQTNSMIFLTELTKDSYGRKIRQMGNEKIKMIKKSSP